MVLHRDLIDLNSIPSHPDIVEAFQALKPHGVSYLTLFRQAVKVTHTIDIAPLESKYEDELSRREQVDIALFALIEEQAKDEEDQENVNGALTIISTDTGMVYRQVLRRYDDMTCKVAKILLVLLIENLLMHREHAHAVKLDVLLIGLTENC